MRRLYVLGCSFTNYAWPTWADLLGVEYDEFENWAFPGLGNRAIVERLAELHAKKNLTKDDTIVIQWSSHIRHDYHSGKVDEGTGVVGWKTGGSIFNYINSDIYDKKWLNRFWDERSYIMHTFNSIVLAQSLLSSIGCKWAMTSMGYIHLLNTDYPDSITGEKIEGLSNIWKDEPAMQVYKKTIFEDHRDRWIYPIGTFAWNSNIPSFRFLQLSDPTKRIIDRHPSVSQHAAWLTLHLKPVLGLSQDLDIRSEKWIDIVNNIYDSSHYNFDHFCEEVFNKLKNERKVDYKGF
tara:strand:- start:17435 stop:18310 length:876 start_codon:yes stop_codon:yes gene_type:complete